MNTTDVTRFAFTALNGARKRTLLMLLAMATGVASVLILTSLGEAARRYVIGEFASLGTNLIIVMPGRSETAGGGLNMLIGETPRDLTLNDAIALQRGSSIGLIAPVNVGSASVSWSGLEREVPVGQSGKGLARLVSVRVDCDAVVRTRIIELFVEEFVIAAVPKVGPRNHRRETVLEFISIRNPAPIGFRRAPASSQFAAIEALSVPRNDIDYAEEGV